MKISKEKAQGLAKKFLKDKDIFGKNPSNNRDTQSPVVPEVVYWSMDDLRGIEKNPPTLIKGKLAETDYDF